MPSGTSAWRRLLSGMSPRPYPANFSREQRFDLGVADHRKVEQPRDRIPRQVVLGRPEPAGHQHDVGSVERHAEHLDDPGDVVADRLMMQDVHADRGEPFGDPPGVRVGDLTEQQLGPDADDLCPHVPADGVAPSLVPKLNESLHGWPGVPGTP